MSRSFLTPGVEIPEKEMGLNHLGDLGTQILSREIRENENISVKNVQQGHTLVNRL